MSEAASPTGMLLVDKPLGMSSMHVCRVVRRRLVNGGAPKRVKVGHGGTLDPLATGLLVVLIGRGATRLANQIMVGTKTYTTTIDLAHFSTTDDAEGELTAVECAEPPELSRIEEACAAMTGTVMQRPPAYSAMKVGGRRAYDLARRGEAPELEARPVQIDSIEVLSYDYPRLELRIVCGKGTYIRSIARDLGGALSTGGHLTRLRRDRIEPYHVADALALDDVPDPLGGSDLLGLPG